MPGTYRSLSAWQHADKLYFDIRDIVKAFPREERFELTAQLRRAALSVPTNIVEGTARFSPKERVHFLRTAWSSLAEVEYLLSVAERLHYVSHDRCASASELIAQTTAALRGLIAKIALAAKAR
jgi:four helix bundle protein